MRDAHDFDYQPEEERPAPRRPVWPETIESAEVVEANPPAAVLPEQGVAAFSPLSMHEMRAEIIAELQAREHDLDRRERGLAEQLALLDQAQRNHRLAQQQAQEELRLQQSRAQAIQADLEGRLARCDDLIAELEDEQSTLDSWRARYQAQHEEISKNVRAELASEHEALAAEREAFRVEKLQFRQRIESQERDLAALHEKHAASWQGERDALRVQLTAKLAQEFADERASFEAERQRWLEERDREFAVLEEERAKQDELFNVAVENLEALRQEQEQQFRERRRALEAEISTQVEWLEARLAEQQTGWEASRVEAETELAALRAELDGQRQSQEQNLESARLEFENFRVAHLQRLDDEAHERLTRFEEERAAWIAEREANQNRLAEEQARLAEEQEKLCEGWDGVASERTELEEARKQLAMAQAELELAKLKLAEDEAALEEIQGQLDADASERLKVVEAEAEEVRLQLEAELEERRAEFERECEAIRRTLDQERAAMENRLQFQGDHLDRTRAGLEEARREVECRLQQAQAESARMREVHWRRWRQLDRYREGLDQKEQSLERQRELLAEMEQEIATARESLAERRVAEDQALQAQRESENLADQRARTDLATRSDQLGQRQMRLETLRVEIESTHRENLELRVALDEAWANLSDAVGPEIARRELQVSRERVAEYFRKREAELDTRRELVLSDMEQARQQSDQLEASRKQLNDWLASSMTTLHRREDDLRRWAGRLDDRERHNQKVAERWRGQRLEVEGVIRGLLEHLADDADDESPRIAAGTVPIGIEHARRAAG